MILFLVFVIYIFSGLIVWRPSTVIYYVFVSGQSWGYEMAVIPLSLHIGQALLWFLGLVGVFCYKERRSPLIPMEFNPDKVMPSVDWDPVSWDISWNWWTVISNILFASSLWKPCLCQFWHKISYPVIER